MNLNKLSKKDVQELFEEAKKYDVCWKGIEDNISFFITLCELIIYECNEQTYLDSGGRYRGETYVVRNELIDLIKKEIDLILKQYYKNENEKTRGS